MAEQVLVAKKEEEDRQAAALLVRFQESNKEGEPEKENESAEDKIWQVTDVTKEEYETTEGEMEEEVDVVAALLELTNWV